MFAVVSSYVEAERIFCTLRYKKNNAGQWVKLTTQEADELLSDLHPDFLFFSNTFDAKLHAIPATSIAMHYHPQERLQEIHKYPYDDFTQKVSRLIDLLTEKKINTSKIGITGSGLIGAQNAASDIDLVIYDRDTFHSCRRLFRQLIKSKFLTGLKNEDWKIAYNRRGCSISLEAYIWHESRKFNKAIFEDTKVDLSFVDEDDTGEQQAYKKTNPVSIEATIIDDQYAFDSPARYLIEHPDYSELVSFTPTYAGQAIKGEKIKAVGVIEKPLAGGQPRVVLGSSREAPGEYIISLEY